MVNTTQMDIYNNGTNSTDDYLDNTGENDYCEGYRDVDFLLRSIWMYAGYPILVLGTVGHSLVIVLLLLNKRLRSLPLSVLVLTMSASGLLALCTGLLPTIVKHHTCHHVRFEDQTTETGCQLLMAAIYFSLQLYSWTEASVAVERMCAIRWALAHRTLSSGLMNKIALPCIIIALMAINTIHFKIFGMSRGTCDVEDAELFKAWQYAHSITYIFVPVTIMLPSNAVTLHTMLRSRLKNTKNVQKAKPVAIMMLILNLMFMATSAPSLVVDYEHLEAVEYEAVQVAWAVSRLMMYFGCSMTFLVYVAVAGKFRKALSELLISGKNNIRSALVPMLHISASYRNAEGGGDQRVSASDHSTTVPLSTCSTKSTTDG